MHEFALADQIVKQALIESEDYVPKRIKRIEVDVGAMLLVVPEALESAFHAASSGSIADGAELSINEVPPTAQCRQCKHVYAPTILSYVCPRCFRADAAITDGRDIVLKAIEFDA